MADTLQDQLQAVLGDSYSVERELAPGGMSRLFLATERALHRKVVVKLLPPELASELSAQRFQREMLVTAKLQHPHILPVLTAGARGAFLYYVMPYVRGESLRWRLDHEGRLPIVEALGLLRELAEALAFAHAEGVVHRDLKPENVLLEHGHALLADFGIASAREEALQSERLTGTGLGLGTPGYMAPEQLAGDPDVNARADIYALGVVGYEMLAGAPPFAGSTPQELLAAHLTKMPRPLCDVRPEVPQSLSDAIARALAKLPEERFATAAAFSDSLESRISAAGGATIRLHSSSVTVARAGVPNLGWIVSRTCNRWPQVNAFDAHFRTEHRRRPGRPHLYVVHGEEGEAHESLVERLVATRISHFAAELSGVDRGTVANMKVPWPVGDPLETRKRDLQIALFREADPSYLDEDLSARALGRLAPLSLNSVVVIQHQLRAPTWDRATEELLAWYVDAFWGSLAELQQGPLFLVFLELVYPPPRAMRLAWPPWPRVTSSRILQRLEQLLVAQPRLCSTMIFKALTSVTADDVKQWFSQNGIYDSEQRWRQLADDIFRTREVKHMAEVEVALREIHSAFVSNLSASRERLQ